MEKKTKPTGRKPGSKNLTRQEVQVLYKMQGQGKTYREIVKETKVSLGCLNGWLGKQASHPNENIWKRMDSRTKADYVFSTRRANRNKFGKKQKLSCPELKRFVINKIVDQKWSPERISDHIRNERPEWSISAKAIYNYLHKHQSAILKSLRWNGRKRKKHTVKNLKKCKRAAPDKKSIHDRPEKAHNRAEIGHWEVDSIVSCKSGKGAILSMIERVTRMRVFRYIPNLQAGTVHGVIWAILVDLPPELRRTFTFDNGSEFAISTLSDLEQKFEELDFYFCDAYASWQKGAVEKSNLDFRQFFPKGTDFSKVLKEDIRSAQDIINDRPMLCLNNKTPQKMWSLALELIRLGENSSASTVLPLKTLLSLHSLQNLSDCSSSGTKSTGLDSSQDLLQSHTPCTLGTETLTALGTLHSGDAELPLST
jgi:IS30 family transposase